MSPTGTVNAQSRSDDAELRERSYVTVQLLSGDVPSTAPFALLKSTDVKVIFAFRGLTMYSSPPTSDAVATLARASGWRATRLDDGAPDVPPSTKLIVPATVPAGGAGAGGPVVPSLLPPAQEAAAMLKSTGEANLVMRMAAS